MDPFKGPGDLKFEIEDPVATAELIVIKLRQELLTVAVLRRAEVTHLKVSDIDSTGIGCGEKPTTGSFPATVGIRRITRSTKDRDGGSRLFGKLDEERGDYRYR